MKIKTPSKKVFSFNQLYKNITNMKSHIIRDYDSHPRFRLSSSPFCAYKFLFKWASYIKDGSTWDYHADFFTSIGTSVHSSIQKWIALENPGYILGNWKCNNCCKYPLSEECLKCTKKCKFYLESKVGPKFCPKCGKAMHYVEFHFIIKPLISGHCDGIMLYGDRVKNLIEDLEIDKYNTDKMDKYLKSSKKPLDSYVLEYKTTTRGNASKLESPKIEHKAQALMYTKPAQELLDIHGLNIEVKGAIIKYITRDLPSITSRDFLIYMDNIDYYNQNVNMAKLILKCILRDDIKYLNSLKILPCKSTYKEFYALCPYKEECLELRNNIGEVFDYTKKDIKKSFIEYKRKFKDKLK